MTEKLRRPLELWHLIIVVVLAVATPILAGAAQYGRRETEFEQYKQKTERNSADIQTLQDASARTERNIIRIGVALKVPDLEKPGK